MRQDRGGTPARQDVVARLRAAGCVFAEDEARLLLSAPGGAAQLEAALRRRVAGEPLEHILGWVDFAGLRLAVGPGVFVPRRRSGLLVAQAAACPGAGAVVVELCCGVAAVASALGARCRPAELHATDIDPAAAALAAANLAPYGGTAHVGDLDAALPAHLAGRVGVLVANAPYVPSDAIALMPPEARLHEPRAALDGGADGLAVHRRIAAAAPRWVAPGGHVLIETSERQAAGTAALLAAAGLAPRVVRDDELDATVVVAQQPAP